MSRELGRRALAESVGTALLVTAVIGSGIAASRLSPDDVGLQLLENSIATGTALTALILALGSVSASFNPVVTLVGLARGEGTPSEATLLVVAQVGGGAVGAVLANLMFDLPMVSVAGSERWGTHLWLSELVATTGLVLVVVGTRETGSLVAVASGVGGYIVAAYWFTSSTSFANPAVTIARSLSNTFAGIAPTSAVPFVAAQLVGGGLALLLVRVLYPVREIA